MRQLINEPISVFFVSDPGKMVQPLFVGWRGARYKVQQLSHTFTVPRGLGKCHIYCLLAGEQYFEVLLDPLTMVFTLREVHDGRPD